MAKKCLICCRHGSVSVLEDGKLIEYTEPERYTAKQRNISISQEDFCEENWGELLLPAFWWRLGRSFMVHPLNFCSQVPNLFPTFHRCHITIRFWSWRDNLLTLIAAFISLSCFILQSVHIHLSFKVRFELWNPQTLQSLEDGLNCPIRRIVFPNHSALYSNFVTKLLQAESPKTCAKHWFFCIPLTFKVSSAIAWFSLIILNEVLCWKSFL